MPWHELPRFFRTVRHLRPSQAYWRARYVAERRLSRVRGKKSVATAGANGSVPRVRFDVPRSLFNVDGGPADEKLVRQLSLGAFEHLNQVRELGRPVNWLLGPIDHDRLWTVTLHYHHWAYDLARLAARRDETGEQASRLFVELISDWIARCDVTIPGSQPLAWNAYAIATRIGWWIRSALLLDTEWWSQHDDFRAKFLTSLWKQAGYLADHIEWDLGGNHLIRDALGLAWAGRIFDGPEAKKWLKMATSLAVEQCREQVLADGGHFERSPMYHLHVMEDLLLISLLIEDPAAKQRLQSVLERMTEFARWARHPDGGIPLLNDAALEADFRPDDLLNRAAESGLSVDASLSGGGRHFAETGLAVWHGKPWTVFFDVGPLGPDYQPGHGHADNLTLECSYGSERLFVDPGTYSYDCDDRRANDRSTAAHNTVCVDRTDSSEVWHIFRVGRRAKPVRVDVRAKSDGLDASAAHDGYAHLDVFHQRRIQVAEGGSLVIADRIEGRGIHHLEGGWLLAPGWTAAVRDFGWEIQHENRVMHVTLHGPNGLRTLITSRPWHPSFGLELATQRLGWEWQGQLPFELRTVVGPAALSSR
jgi:uncharacterized heparinase superfamily protein